MEWDLVAISTTKNHHCALKNHLWITTAQIFIVAPVISLDLVKLANIIWLENEVKCKSVDEIYFVFVVIKVFITFCLRLQT